jgi:hypothetical protein
MNYEPDETEALTPVPPKQSLFPLTAEDILDNALNNLDERQAGAVSKKAAEELVRVAVERRLAEQKSASAQAELGNLVHNANLLDQRGGDYKITGTFEHASGTTVVELQRSKTSNVVIIAAVAGLVALLLLLVVFLVK